MFIKKLNNSSFSMLSNIQFIVSFFPILILLGYKKNGEAEN